MQIFLFHSLWLWLLFNIVANPQERPGVSLDFRPQRLVLLEEMATLEDIISQRSLFPRSAQTSYEFLSRLKIPFVGNELEWRYLSP